MRSSACQRRGARRKGSVGDGPGVASGVPGWGTVSVRRGLDRGSSLHSFQYLSNIVDVDLTIFWVLLK